jgi:hypothetical protein
VADVSDEAKAGAVDVDELRAALKRRETMPLGDGGPTLGEYADDAIIHAAARELLRRDAAPAQRPQADDGRLVELLRRASIFVEPDDGECESCDHDRCKLARDIQQALAADFDRSIAIIADHMTSEVMARLPTPSAEDRATHVERAREAMSVLGDALEMIAAGDAEPAIRAALERCAKCGSADLHRLYYAGGWHERLDVNPACGTSDDAHTGEHFHRRCQCCSYQWTEPLARRAPERPSGDDDDDANGKWDPR